MDKNTGSVLKAVIVASLLSGSPLLTHFQSNTSANLSNQLLFF